MIIYQNPVLGELKMAIQTDDKYRIRRNADQQELMQKLIQKQKVK